jgi:hypothetical protein
MEPKNPGALQDRMTLLGEEDRKEVIQLATRPNGSVNVSRMLDMATVRYAAHLETR